MVSEAPYFKAAKCCLNCVHRQMTIETKVICNRWNEAWIPARLICDAYEATTVKSIRTGEATSIKNAYKEYHQKVETDDFGDK